MPELEALMDTLEASQRRCDYASRRAAWWRSLAVAWVLVSVLFALVAGHWLFALLGLGALLFVPRIRRAESHLRVEVHCFRQYLKLWDETFEAAMYLGDLTTMQIAHLTIRRRALDGEPEWGADILIL